MLDIVHRFLNHCAEKLGLDTYKNDDSILLDEISKLSMLADELLYDLYDPTTEIFSLKNNYLGIFFEIDPVVGISNALEKNIENFFATEIPLNTYFQITLIASHKISNPLTIWSKLRTNTNPVIEKFTKRRFEFLLNKATDFYSNIIVRDYKIYISVSQQTKNIAAFLEVKNSILRKFETFSANPKSLDAQTLINVVTDILQMNKDINSSAKIYNPFEPLSNSCVHSTSNPMLIEDKQIKHIKTNLSSRLFSVLEYPKEFSLARMINLLGDGSYLNLSIPGRFIISQTIATNISSNDHYIAKANAVIKSAEQFYSRNNTILQSEAIEWINTVDSIKKQQRVLNTSFLVMVTTDINKLEECSATITSLFNMNNWRLEAITKTVQLPSLLFLLPMQSGYYFSALQYLRMTRIGLSDELLAMLPIHAEWKGVPMSGVPLIGRRGQLFNWNPFYRLSGGNYNVCVFGPSGSGKSVFLQELTQCMLAQNTKIFILDIGQSFKNLCSLLDGEMIQFSANINISLNPFSAIKDTNNKEALMCVGLIISSMCGAENKSEEAQVEKAIVRAIYNYADNVTISKIVQELELLETTESIRMSIALFPYTVEGKYGDFFDKPSNIHFSKQITVFEFEEIKNDTNLLSVVLQLISMQIFMQVLKGDRQSQFMIIVDEAWMILDYCAKFLSNLARTIRKYGGSLVVCVQSYDDFQKTEEHRTIFSNSTWTIMLKQDEKGLNSFKASEAFKDMVPLIKSIQFRPGEYSECLIYTTGLQIIGRMILDLYSATLFSTDAKDFAFLTERTKLGMNIDEAIEELMLLKKLR